jgi:hypothetical protein
MRITPFRVARWLVFAAVMAWAIAASGWTVLVFVVFGIALAEVAVRTLCAPRDEPRHAADR